MSASWPTALATDSTLYVAVNELQNNLASGIDNAVTTLPLNSTTSFPTVGLVLIDNEIIQYTGISGNSLTGCTRGFDGTSAAAHASSTVVSFAVMAAHHNTLKDEIKALEADLHNRFGFGNATPANSRIVPINTAASQVLTTDSSGQIQSSATLPVARGGTNSGTGLNSNRMMISSGGAIVEQSALTISKPMRTDGSGLPTTGNTSLTAEVSGVLPVANGGTGQSALSSLVPTLQKFTSGSGTYTTPAGCTWLRIRMVGGGGGGSGSGTGGGPGGNGGNGGNTTFGSSLLAANGGGGGLFAGAVGTGGTASLGSGPIGIALTGGTGGGAFSNNGGVNVYVGGGAGGSSPFGGAGGMTQANTAGVAAVANTGSGGSGGSNTGSVVDTAGNGGGAGGYVDAIITAPAGTYAYAVGVAGTVGTAGTSGFAGGLGGSGLILVEEHYI